jgi:hypothetical protein
MFDLTQDDLNVGMRVFNLGIPLNYAPAISFTAGLVMQDAGPVQMDEGAQWFGAIRMSSVNSSGFARMSVKHQSKLNLSSVQSV